MTSSFLKSPLYQVRTLSATHRLCDAAIIYKDGRDMLAM